jgi:small subunit ribosomal protein S6
MRTMPLYEHVFLARQDLAQAQVDALAENATKINEDVIRYMTLKLDEVEQGPSAMMRRGERDKRRGDRDDDRGDRGDRGGRGRGRDDFEA